MSERHSRQGFLGRNNEELLKTITVGYVGLGGGGSHLVQQFSHIGVQNHVLTDKDIVEESNLNRLIGATYDDVHNKTPKVHVAERLIKGLVPTAKIQIFQTDWQLPQASLALRRCSVIFGSVDSLAARAELEQFCRRFLIPYIDIGMDVHQHAGGYSIHGQVCLSLPGDLCMRCMGILQSDKITKEVQRYGAAGGHPQVVWSNGILASHAVQIFMQLVTEWQGKLSGSGCWEYDGNNNRFGLSNRIAALEGTKCKHYPADEVGDPFFA